MQDNILLAMSSIDICFIRSKLVIVFTSFINFITTTYPSYIAKAYYFIFCFADIIRRNTINRRYFQFQILAVITTRVSFPVLINLFVHILTSIYPLHNGITLVTLDPYIPSISYGTTATSFHFFKLTILGTK